VRHEEAVPDEMHVGLDAQKPAIERIEQGARVLVIVVCVSAPENVARVIIDPIHPNDPSRRRRQYGHEDKEELR